MEGVPARSRIILPTGVTVTFTALVDGAEVWNDFYKVVLVVGEKVAITALQHDIEYDYDAEKLSVLVEQ